VLGRCTTGANFGGALPRTPKYLLAAIGDPLGHVFSVAAGDGEPARRPMESDLWWRDFSTASRIQRLLAHLGARWVLDRMLRSCSRVRSLHRCARAARNRLRKQAPAKRARNGRKAASGAGGRRSKSSVPIGKGPGASSEVRILSCRAVRLHPSSSHRPSRERLLPQASATLVDLARPEPCVE